MNDNLKELIEQEFLKFYNEMEKLKIDNYEEKYLVNNFDIVEDNNILVRVKK